MQQSYSSADRSIATQALRQRRACRALLAAAGCAAVLAGHAHAQPNAPKAPPTIVMPAERTARPSETAYYNVSRFVFLYATDNAALPPVDELLKAPVELGQSARGYTAPTADGPNVTRTVGELNDLGGTYDASAIGAVSRAVVAEMSRRGLAAIMVAPSSRDVDAAGTDLRAERKQTELNLVVSVGVINEVRVMRTGVGSTAEPRADGSSAAKTIATESPIKPGGALEKDNLEDYLYRLNRTQGRVVDATVSAGSAGGVALDYVISDIKPWTVYGQLSNTGTEQTNVWRERFGFIDNNLTSHGDIFQVDYQTAGFNDSNNLSVSYDYPLMDKLRLKGFASVNNYTASDVGQTGSNFEGQGYSFGAETAWNIWQHREAFLDLYGGLRYEHTKVTQTIPSSEGQTGFCLPSIGLRYDRLTNEANTTAYLALEGNLSGVTNDAEAQMLGRTPVDISFAILKGAGEQSFYVEPLLGLGSSLAHEIAFIIRGQTAFNARLPPTYESVIGGFFSVRGYPEAVLAGDDIVVGTAEYRLHIPRLYSIKSQPGRLFGNDFRWSPTEEGGRTDWDLIFRVFLDAGTIMNNNIQPYESNGTLVGTGVGLELQILRNVSVRLDWGVALDSLHDALGNTLTDSGDNRFHFIATLSF